MDTKADNTYQRQQSWREKHFVTRASISRSCGKQACLLCLRGLGQVKQTSRVYDCIFVWKKKQMFQSYP